MKNTLKVTMPSDREVQMTRVFDAPRELVWRAMSTPELLKRWLTGAFNTEMTVCEVDSTVGGKYRYTWRGPDGSEMTMTGVHKEVVPPERCVRTEAFEVGGRVLGETLATAVLTEKDGKTTLTVTVLYPSKEARDGHIMSGMEKGAGASYDRLEELLATMPAK